MSKILSGKEVSEHVKQTVSAELNTLNGTPGLAVILVGDNAASKVYVNHKKKVCDQLGIASFEFLIDGNEPEERLIEVLDECNANSDIHGILLQLPLPKGYDEDAMLQRILPEKDVDGFHPMNVGKALIGLDAYKSCTPYGVMEILRYYDIDPEGKHVVVLGRSNIVGKPMASFLLQKEAGANATVTVCHSRTQNLEALCSQADILIAAIGIPEFVKSSMVKPGAVIIDVGINRIDSSEHPSGSKLVGDVDFEDVKEVCSAITPVPGGVGPMTIAMLMKNTLKAFRAQTKQ